MDNSDGTKKSTPWWEPFAYWGFLPGQRGRWWGGCGVEFPRDLLAFSSDDSLGPWDWGNPGPPPPFEFNTSADSKAALSFTLSGSKVPTMTYIYIY